MIRNAHGAVFADGSTGRAPSRGTPTAAPRANQRFESSVPSYTQADTGDGLGPNDINKSALFTLLKDLPQPVATNIWADDLHHMPEGNKNAGWQTCLNLVDKRDKDLCQGHREQIDTLLVFAGLFSAVVTAFAVESYQWLEEDPVETSVALLRDLVFLIAQNTTQTVVRAAPTTSNLDSDAIVRVNVCWFVSLCLSLSAALVGILCKQWLREYERDVGQAPEHALAIRRIRFQGLEHWKVGGIVTAMPILLQLALALFLIGVADLLWQLHPTVAGCVTAVCGLTLTFYLTTTFLPLVQYATICFRCCGPPERADNYCFLEAFTQPQCAFKSAQAWVLIRLARPIIDYCLRTYAGAFTFHDPPETHALILPPANSWATFDINWTKRREHVHLGPHAAYETLSWVAQNLDGVGVSASIWHCVWGRRLGTLGDVDDTAYAAADIGCVAEAYPSIAKLDQDLLPMIRTQSLCFQCALRTELSANTSIEQLLRIAPVVGVNSEWTRAAIDAIVSLYDQHELNLSDDISMGLLRLAELQTMALVGMDAEITLDPDHPHLPFLQIARLLFRGSEYTLRGSLMPAMCAFAVSWIETQPPVLVESMAKDLLHMTTTLYLALGFDPRELPARPGVGLVSQFAHMMNRVWPSPHSIWAYYTIEHRQVISALLALAPGGDGDCAPFSTENHASEPLDRRVHTPCPEGQVRIDVRQDLTEDARMENDSKSLAAPLDNPAERF